MSFLLANLHTLQNAYPEPLVLQPPEIPIVGGGVPKYVWRTWKDDSWKRECVSAYQHSKRVLSDWHHFVWDDAQCRTFVQANFHTTILQIYDLCGYSVMRADLWRYLILYWFGGLYVDMKTTILRKPTFGFKLGQVPRVYSSPWDLSHFNTFHPHLFQVGELQQFWVAAEPGAPALWNVVCQIAANILQLATVGTDSDLQFPLLPKVDTPKSRVISVTGPIVYTYSLAKTEMSTPNSVVILGCDCDQAIQYFSPDKREMTVHRADHYSKQRQQLVTR